MVITFALHTLPALFADLPSVRVEGSGIESHMTDMFSYKGWSKLSVSEPRSAKH